MYVRHQYNVDEDIQLGPGGRTTVGWSRGSSGGSRTSSQELENKTTVPSNRFEALASDQNIPSDSRRVLSRTVTPSSRDSSKGRGTNVIPSAQRSGKVVAQSQKEREQAIAAVKTMASAESGRPQMERSRESSVNREEMKEKMLRAPADYSEQEIQKRAKPLLDELLHTTYIDEAIMCVSEICTVNTIHFFVTVAMNHVLERSAQARQQIGRLMHDMIKLKYMTPEQYMKGLQGILSLAEDYVIDIPHVWEYLGELIAPMIEDNMLSLSIMQEAFQSLPIGFAGCFVSAVLHAVSKKLGPHKVGEMWRATGLQWSDYLPTDKNEKEFITENKLEFTVNRRESCIDPHLSIDKIKEELKRLFSNDQTENEEVFDWIDVNVGETRCREPSFVRALMSAVCQSALIKIESTLTVNEKLFRYRCNILKKYFDHKETCEMHALYSLQALMHQLEHPKDVLGLIFDYIYDEDVISEDAFLQWERSEDPAEMEGKGVALNSVRRFYNWLSSEMENESVDES